jgi:Heat shock protein
MKRTFLLITFLIALCIGVAAQPLHIDARQWKLVELNGSPIKASNAYLEFDFDQKRMTGNSGCNRMFGGFEISGRKLAFSNIATTRMACPDMAAETALLTALKSVDRFRQSGNTLELSKGRTVVIRFADEKASVRAFGLEEKKWVLESIGSQPVSTAGRSAFLVFDKAKASAGGNSSCNVFGGSYSTTGQTIEIIEIISTMMACLEDSRMDIERQFLDALRETNRYKIRNNKLMLYRDEGLLLTMTGEPK